MVMTMMWQCHLSSSECRCYRLNGFSLFKRLPIPLSSGSRMLEQSVGEWLESIGLQQYESKLLLNGFDDVRFLVSSCWDPTGSTRCVGQTLTSYGHPMSAAEQIWVLQRSRMVLGGVEGQTKGRSKGCVGSESFIFTFNLGDVVIPL